MVMVSRNSYLKFKSITGVSLHHNTCLKYHIKLLMYCIVLLSRVAYWFVLRTTTSSARLHRHLPWMRNTTQWRQVTYLLLFVLNKFNYVNAMSDMMHWILLLFHIILFDNLRLGNGIWEGNASTHWCIVFTQEHTGICFVLFGLWKFCNSQVLHTREKVHVDAECLKSFYVLFKARMLNKVINLRSNINQLFGLLQCCYFAEGRLYGHNIPGYQFIILAKG